VGVDEAGDDGGPAQVDDPRVTIAPGLHVATPADREHTPPADRERRRRRPAGIEREDPTVVEDRGSGYFIQPFSR
jgi:hypothetical protein